MTETVVLSVGRSIFSKLGALTEGPVRTIIFVVRWLLDQAEKDRERFVIWSPVFLGFGVVLYFALPSEPGRHIGLFASITGSVLLLFAIRASRQTLRLVLLAFVLSAIGFELAQMRTWSVAGPVLNEDKRPRDVLGQVVQVSFLTPSGVKAVVRPTSIERTSADQLPDRIRVTIKSRSPLVLPGDWILLPAVLGPPPGPVAPGAFDFRRMYWFDRIGGVGYAIGKPQHVGAQRDNLWMENLEIKTARFRSNLTQRIQGALTGPDGAIASALLTGERAAIAKEDLQALRDSGLAHLLAISGLHMGLAGFGIFVALRFILSFSETLTLRYPIKKWAAGFALVGILFYLIASGMAVSAQRAFIMTSVIFLAIIMDRSAFTLRTVAIAASAMIFLTPEVVMEAGFQMSFAAVICLVSAYEFIRSKRFFEDRRSERSVLRTGMIYFVGIAVTSWIASMATSPMAAYHFHRVVHYSVLADLVAMPLMGFVVMPSAIASFLAMPLGLEHVPLMFMGWGIRQILHVGQFVSSLPGSVVGVAAWPPLAFGLVILGGLWLCLWREAWRLLGIPVMAIGLLWGMVTKQPDILVSDEGGQVLYRGHNGQMIALDTRRKRFQTEAWMRREGDLRPLGGAKPSNLDHHRCDAWGCAILLPNNQILAVSKHIAALEEDCQTADIMISTRPVRNGCQRPQLVIDRFDLWRNGTYAIWLRPDRITYQTTRSAEKTRPWTQGADQ